MSVFCVDWRLSFGAVSDVGDVLLDGGGIQLALLPSIKGMSPGMVGDDGEAFQSGLVECRQMMS